MFEKIQRQQRNTRALSSAASDVYKRQDYNKTLTILNSAKKLALQDNSYASKSLNSAEQKPTDTKSSDIDGLGFDNIDDLDILNENLVEPKLIEREEMLRNIFEITKE
ncbi:hypothetical protein [Francisella tularensis]|uniref:hypothetical protein n=1 Tax=Francisella tularensis TaxID=263 RepID=UPI001F22702C|nr:hypothetical protein [Francisella tularensis]